MQLKTETKVGLFVLIAMGTFAYMATYLGTLKLFSNQYNYYYIYFDDLSGLEKKADIKISGVKVGLIDDIKLIENGSKAKITAAVNNDYVIYGDASALIKQENLMGNKYLEIIPGDPRSGTIGSGGSFGKDVLSMPSMETLIRKFDSIATNIENLSSSLQNALGSNGQQNELKLIMHNIQQASSRIAVFTDVLSRNERNIDQLLSNMHAFSQNIVPVGNQINKVADKLYTDVLPSLQDSILKISKVFDRDFNRVSTNLEATLENIQSVAKKIDQGKGLFGKLVNETDIYDDIKVISQGFRDYATFADNLGIVVDAHGEYMNRPGEHYRHEDSKGYLDIRFYTSEDLFYMFQVVSSEKGNVSRHVIRNKYFDQCNRELGNEQIRELPPQFFFEPIKTDRVVNTRNAVRFGFQVGKIYKDIALRFGIIEGFAGAAVDYELPTFSENFRWVTTFEAFDFTGQNKIDDRRPHLKWINRVYFLRNLYTDFGADDFISKKNSNAFFGFGLRFSDDDLKYLLSKAGALVGGGFVAESKQ